MIRIHVSLDKRQHNRVKDESRRLGISVAEFVRKAIQRELPPDEPRSWMRYAGFVDNANNRAAQSIDEVVYASDD